MSSASDSTRPFSSIVLDGPDRAPNRSMLRAVGFGDADFKKPVVGIASTWSMVTPCNMHIDQLARDAEAGANAAGGKAIIFGTITLGIWPLVTWVKLAGHIRNAQRAAGLTPSCSGGVGFLLAIFGFGVLYYQVELNKVVKNYGDAAPGTPVPLAA